MKIPAELGPRSEVVAKHVEQRTPRAHVDMLGPGTHNPFVRVDARDLHLDQRKRAIRIRALVDRLAADPNNLLLRLHVATIAPNLDQGFAR